MKEYLYIDISPITEKYSIYNHFDFGLKYGGSYRIFCAHMLGLSYDQYLRMCRDVFHAELIGKEGFTKTYWDKKEDAEPLVELLNKTYNLILIEREKQKNKKLL